MSNGEKQMKKGDKHMAVLTARCDQPFVVASSKAKAFREQKKDIKASERVEALITKISNNVKIDVREDNR